MTDVDGLLARLDFVNDPALDEARAAAEEALGSLKAFVRLMWPVVEQRHKFVDNWHIDAVCEHLEAVSAGEIERLIINVPPRSSKSLLTQVFWPSWEWLSRPESQWVFAAYSQRLANKHSRVCLRLIQSSGARFVVGSMPLARRIGYRGVLELLGQSWDLSADETGKTLFSNTETGQRLATSVGGTATGEGGDFLVVDDAVKAQDARSDTVRKAANEWFDETFSTRTNSPSSAFVVIGQRLHAEDLPGHLLARGGWTHLVLPGQFEPSHRFVWPGDPRIVEGESLDPVRLPPKKLADLKRDLGSYGFAGQIQQRPAPAEGGQFKRHWWQRWTPSSLPPRWERQVASWDMRFSESQASTTSYVVGQVWGVNGAERYLLAQIRARLSFTETVRAVLALSGAWPDARSILVEQKANGAAVIDTLRARVPGLIAIEPEGGKDVRAAAVEPFVEAGNIFLPAADEISAPPGYEPTSVADFLEELSAFPSGAHDDQVDAFSQALNWLANKQGGGGFGTFNVYTGESSSFIDGRMVRVDGAGSELDLDGIVLRGEEYMDVGRGGRLEAPAGHRIRGHQ